MLFLMGVFIFLMCFPSDQLAPNRRSRLIIWNVGQGQWVTYSGERVCLHFDMGGEFAPFNKVYKECRRKKNVLFLSHGDWDHIRFAHRFKKRLLSLCLWTLPRETLSTKKEIFLKSLSSCSKQDSFLFQDWVQEIFFSFSKGSQRGGRRKRRALTSNDFSRVFLLMEKVLLPGDSTIRSERLWLKHVLLRGSIKWALASHHGSRFSNSEELLSALPRLQTIIVSARKKRYGHPHPLVLQRWKKAGVSVLKTEAWGNIYLEMPVERLEN